MSKNRLQQCISCQKIVFNSVGTVYLMSKNRLHLMWDSSCLCQKIIFISCEIARVHVKKSSSTVLKSCILCMIPPPSSSTVLEQCILCQKNIFYWCEIARVRVKKSSSTVLKQCISCQKIVFNSVEIMYLMSKNIFLLMWDSSCSCQKSSSSHVKYCFVRVSYMIKKYFFIDVR
jgi:hypothetical protein